MLDPKLFAYVWLISPCLILGCCQEEKNEHLMISRLQCIRIGKLDLRVKGVQGQMEMEIMGKSLENDGKMPSWRPLTLADTD
jgi:hypothetical protein